MRLQLSRPSPTQIVTLCFWWRVNGAGPLMHAFLGAEVALSLLALVWLRAAACGAVPPGSYERWREAITVAMRTNEALLGATLGWTVAWIDLVGPGAPDLPRTAAAARHVALLLMGSGALAHLLTWPKALRLRCGRGSRASLG